MHTEGEYLLWPGRASFLSGFLSAEPSLYRELELRRKISACVQILMVDAFHTATVLETSRLGRLGLPCAMLDDLAAALAHRNQRAITCDAREAVRILRSRLNAFELRRNTVSKYSVLPWHCLYR